MAMSELIRADNGRKFMRIIASHPLFDAEANRIEGIFTMITMKVNVWRSFRLNNRRSGFN